MNIRIELTALLSISILAMTAAGFAKEKESKKYDTYNGFTMPVEPVLPARESHPSLWFGKEGVEALRQKRDADDYARSLWQKLSHDPLLTVPLPEVPKDGGEELHKYYGEMSMLAKLNALMSLVVEDGKQEPYRLRAIAALRRAYDGPIYSGKIQVKTGGGIEDIHRATWAQNYAAAYDWVQPDLSREDDQAIRQRLAKEAQTISDNLFVWTDRPHNHLSKPAWGLASLALALSDHPKAKDWLAKAIQAANQNTKYFFSADGIYREGPHYLLFSALNFIPFLYHYRNVSGVDGFPVFQPAFEAVVATRNGQGWLPNIYDSYLRPFPTHMVARPYLTRSTWLNPDAKLGNVLQWNFRNTDFEVFERAQAKSGYNYTGASLDYTLEADEFLTYDPAIQPIAPSVSPTIFLKGGQTIFRNHWSFNNPSDRYLLFQGVAEADNHFHYDHLSFIIQAENQMMASDSGYTRGNFGDSSRKTWYITPAAHNVVASDGKAPIDTGENVTPVSRDSLETGFFAFQEKEAPYPNRAVQKRAIAFPGGEYFVVIDQLAAPQPADYTLFLHGGRGEMSSDGPRRVWTYSRDAYGPPARLAAWVLSDGAKLEDRKGELTYIKGDYAEFGYVAASQKSRDATFMQILIPLAADAQLPAVVDLSSGSAIAATVEKNGVLDTFTARRDAAQVKAGKLETDGRFAWTRSQNGLAEWAMQSGTVLTYDGADVVRVSEPITIAGRLSNTGYEVAINAGSTNYTVDFPLRKNSRLKFATFNGKQIDAPTAAGRFSLRLSGSGQLAAEIVADEGSGGR